MPFFSSRFLERLLRQWLFTFICMAVKNARLERRVQGERTHYIQITCSLTLCLWLIDRQAKPACFFLYTSNSGSEEHTTRKKALCLIWDSSKTKSEIGREVLGPLIPDGSVKWTWEIRHKSFPSRQKLTPTEEETLTKMRVPTLRYKTLHLLGHTSFWRFLR